MNLVVFLLFIFVGLTFADPRDWRLKPKGNEFKPKKGANLLMVGKIRACSMYQNVERIQRCVKSVVLEICERQQRGIGVGKCSEDIYNGIEGEVMQKWKWESQQNVENIRKAKGHGNIRQGKTKLKKNGKKRPWSNDYNNH